MMRFAALLLVLAFAVTATLARSGVASAAAIFAAPAAAGVAGGKEAASSAPSAAALSFAPASAEATNRCPYAGGGVPSGALCAIDKATDPDAVAATRRASARSWPAGGRRLTGCDTWRPKRPPRPLA